MSNQNSQPYNEEFFEGLKLGSIASAEQILPVIQDLINPSSAIDIGCGTGGFLSIFKKLGLKDVLGIDGDYVQIDQLLIDENEFKSHDLSKPLKINSTFDVCLSLEVAEHLPEDSADQFVKSLVSLAPVILFSAAVPHQGGNHHVNEQWPDYWQKKFATEGYIAIDCLREKFWTNKSVNWWYAQNMFLYVHKDHLKNYCKLENFHRTNENPNHLQPLIHPDLYMTMINHIIYLESQKYADEQK